MREISDEQRRWRLALRHRLVPERRTDDIAQITDDLVALHSSDPATVFLSAFARMKRPSVATVEEALYRRRTVVRHHAMRRTLWVMTPNVARLAHGSATSKIAKAERARMVAALADTTDIEHSDEWLADAKAEVVSLLAEHGPLTTREIGQALPHLVRPVTFGTNTKHPASLNAHTKVLQGAGFDGLVVRGEPGSWNSAEYPWIVTNDWLGSPLSGLHEREAAGPLLERWLRRFGPASMTDIRWWFGWTATLSKQALADCSAVEVRLEGGTAAFVAHGEVDEVANPGPWVRLLPGLDPTPMGWKERDWYLEPADVPSLFDRFGNAGPTVWADGRIVGGWSQRPDGAMAIELTRSIDPHHQSLLDGAALELGAAIGDVVVRPRFPAPVQKHLNR